MACEGCNSAPQETALDRVFDGSWPKGAPFPPMAPYLAAAVSRQQALDWAEAVGAPGKAAVVAGDSGAILDFVGKAMMDPGETYAAERKKRKPKKDDTSGSPSSDCKGSVFDSMLDCTSWVRTACGADGRCEPTTDDKFCGTCTDSSDPGAPTDPSTPGTVQTSP